MNNLQIAAQLMLDTFEHKTRDNGESFVFMNDTKLEWMTDIMYECHMGNIPNDFMYNVVYRVLDALVDEENPDIDNMLPCYNHELATIQNNYSEYIDQALREMEPKNYFNMLASANYLLYSDVLQMVINGLTNIVEDLGFDIDDNDMTAENFEDNE